MASFNFAKRDGLAVLAGFAIFCISLGQAQASNPDALWNIVNGQCLRHQIELGNPLPCAQIDLRPGAGFAVLKDSIGIAQFLVIPTMRISGVESPKLLATGSPNYWSYAWQARADVEDRLHRKLARNQVSLAINSAYGRTQNQLHIHVDCVRPDVDQILRQHLSKIGKRWAPLGFRLENHPYWAMRIIGSTLGTNNPFKLLAEGVPAAREHMDRQTLVLIGATFKDGKEGFILLADHVDLDNDDHASGEELQDHDCAIAVR